MTKRWSVVVGITAVMIVTAGAVYLYIRHYQPDRARFPVRGIDVSHHQGTVDWDAVAADDVAFAWVKVSEGGDHRDHEFERNIAEANRVGVPVGIYHFFTFCRPAADQAQNFVDAIPTTATQLPPVVDLEYVGNCDRRPTPEEMRNEIETFIAMVEPAREEPLVYYATDEFLGDYGDVLPPRRLWRRSILREPDHGDWPRHEDWVVWQYHPAGRVNGIDGDVDLNVLSGSLDDLIGGDKAASANR